MIVCTHSHFSSPPSSHPSAFLSPSSSPPSPPTVVGERPWLMMPQQDNVFVYVNNSAGDPQNLVLNCQLVDTANVTFQWFRFIADNPESAVMVPAQMVDQTTGILTVYSIIEGDYASTGGVNYYCIATRIIGSSNYSASVRSRTITVFYACKC